MKRIALCVLSRQIGSLGGIGFYVNSFLKAAQGRYVVDLIVDRPIKKDEIPFDEIRSANIICSPETSSYESLKWFMFQKERSAVELPSNIIKSMLHASWSNVYDLIFVNSHEMAAGLFHAGFQRFCPILVFTHMSIAKDYAFSEMGEMNRCLIEIPHITQLASRKIKQVKQVFRSRLIHAEFDLLNSAIADPEPNTALFIGNMSERKRPRDFVDFCVANKFKARVITNESGQKFFQKTFDDLKIEHDVRSGIFGQEKIDFIRKCSLMFHPASDEMMGYAILEAEFFMPIFVLDEEWTYDHPFVNRLKSSMTRVSPNLMNQSDQLRWVRDYLDSTKALDELDQIIETLSKNYDAKTSSPKLKAVESIVKKQQGIDVLTYWKTVAERKDITMEDLYILYKIARNVGVDHQKTLTFLGKSVQSEESFGFEFE